MKPMNKIVEICCKNADEAIRVIDTYHLNYNSCLSWLSAQPTNGLYTLFFLDKENKKNLYLSLPLCAETICALQNKYGKPAKERLLILAEKNKDVIPMLWPHLDDYDQASLSATILGS